MGWRHYLRFNFYWNTQQTNQTTVWDDTKSKRGWWEYWGGDYHRNRAWQNGTGSENMALNEFMSRQVRRKQQPEFNPGLVPGVAIPCSGSSSLLLRRIRILIIHTSLPLHFISYCCHCTLSLSSPTATSVHLHCLLLLSMVLQTPNYAWSATWILRPHNEKVQPFKLPSTRPQSAPRPSHDGSEKTTNFQAKCLV